MSARSQPCIIATKQAALHKKTVESIFPFSPLLGCKLSKCRLIGISTLFNHSTERIFRPHLHLIAACIPPMEFIPYFWRQVVYVIKRLIIGVICKSTVNRTPHLSTIVATPVQNRQDVDNAITCVKVCLHCNPGNGTFGSANNCWFSASVFTRRWLPGSTHSTLSS